MRLLYNVPDIKINNDFTIKSVQEFDEDDDKLYLKVAEYVPQFQRGFVCDMECNFMVVENGDTTPIDTYITTIKDLVLVHINKRVDCESIPEFEYVFYK